MARDTKKNSDFQDRDNQYIENIISIDRVARVVKGGRRFRFRALAVVGDGKKSVGIGVSKGGDIQVAIQKAINVAKKNMITVAVEKGTLPHEVQGKKAGAVVLLKPASPGTGLIAGGTVRAVLETVDIKNVLSKSLGSSNKINTAYATIAALQELTPRDSWITTQNSEKKKPAKKATSKVADAANTDKKPAATEKKAAKAMTKKKTSKDKTAKAGKK